MQVNKLWIGLAAVSVVVGGWYAFRPERLFIDKTVSEKLEGVPARAGNAITSSETSSMSADEMNSTKVSQPTAGENQILRIGTFHSGSHHTEGNATVYRLVDGRRVLRFTDFMTSNGPDVQVYLIEASDAKDNETVTRAGFIHLAELKGNKGDQNYDLPANVDLDKYRAVTIWCRRFSVNFGTAPLTPQRS